MNEHQLRTAIAILVFGTELTERRRLRRLLPAGRSGRGQRNPVSYGFKSALNWFEKTNYIVRQGEHVKIVDRAALLQLVKGNLTSAQNAAFANATLNRWHESWGVRSQTWHELKALVDPILAGANGGH